MESRNTGLAHALGAYTIWGLLPLYLRLMQHVPPFEFVGWRVVFTLPFCLFVVLATGKWAEVQRTLRNPRTLAIMGASAVLIATNWLIYIAAVHSGHVLATSLGYYINPLINVLLGTLVLGERLSRRQWLAVGLAAMGVSLLAFGALDMLWVALSLAVSFAFYGIVRKLAPVESLPGLTVESAILILPALAIIGHYAQEQQGASIGLGWSHDVLLAASGVLTAVPLLLFASSARKLDYSSLGFVQFLSPSIVFVLGLLVFHEPLRPIQLASFALIWIAIALFVTDLLARRKAGVRG